MIANKESYQVWKPQEKIVPALMYFVTGEGLSEWNILQDYYIHATVRKAPTITAWAKNIAWLSYNSLKENPTTATYTQ